MREGKISYFKKLTRFKDLPNLRLSTEKLLLKAGINDVAKLKLVGSVSACLAINQVHNVEINEQFLLSIEGAIRGVHWSTFSQDIRSELWLEYVDARSCIDVVGFVA
ncbi:TfoX-like protein [Vibrio crassostreae]|uniref:TfoX/Sxy family protein n=1 Tax=Vibrio crassostreae TaxID=246167 RepID=UPI0010501C13|nr:TfoX/Sxy family protein [Vibrio crassostreae]TCV24398.1 TfoX-like protein [Vibrio crassostreae]TWD32564.1 TfoX-like protein [Vibrio crassostreae]